MKSSGDSVAISALVSMNSLDLTASRPVEPFKVAWQPPSASDLVSVRTVACLRQSLMDPNLSTTEH